MVSVIEFIYKSGGIYKIKTKEAFVLDNRMNVLKIGNVNYCLDDVKKVTQYNKLGSLEIYKV